MFKECISVAQYFKLCEPSFGYIINVFGIKRHFHCNIYLGLPCDKLQPTNSGRFSVDFKVSNISGGQLAQRARQKPQD